MTHYQTKKNDHHMTARKKSSTQFGPMVFELIKIVDMEEFPEKKTPLEIQHSGM
jgi:hypothetical protein